MIIDEIPTKLIWSKRKTLSLELKSTGLIVRAPRQMSEREIREFLQKKRIWLERHWQKMQEQKAQLEGLAPYTPEEIYELKEKAKMVLPQKVAQYAKIIGVDYGKVGIRCQRTRWGSCSATGNLNFNCLLLLLPEEIIDYIVVHELCHRKQMNHSAEFYREVEAVFPEYRRAQKWLKEQGRLYLGRLQVQ